MSVHILIVDDENEICEMLSRHFRFLGYEVDQAESAEQALEIMSEKRMEVVISDIMMPGMLGTDLVSAIRTEYPMTHVIMITGYVTLENALTCMRRGADTCVFKPLEDLTELDEAVERALDDLRRWKDKFLELQGMKGGKK